MAGDGFTGGPGGGGKLFSGGPQLVSSNPTATTGLSAGSGRQPLAAQRGNSVHRFIQFAYMSGFRNNPVVCERRVYLNFQWRRAGSILDMLDVSNGPSSGAAGSHPLAPDLATINVAFQTSGAKGKTGYLRPDILNLRTRDLYEIKPESRADEGAKQLAEMVVRFNAVAAGWRTSLPDEPQFQAWRSVRPIQLGVWMPPPIIPVENPPLYAYLAAPGLILYARPKRKRKKDAARRSMIQELRDMEQEENALGQDLRVRERRLKIATGAAVVALCLLMLPEIIAGAEVGGTIEGGAALEGGGAALEGGGAAAEGAGATEAAADEAGGKLIDAAARFRPVRPDLASEASRLAEKDVAAAVAPMLGDDPMPLLPPPPEKAAAESMPKNEAEFIADAAAQFLLGLPESAPGVEARAALEDSSSQIDLSAGAVYNRSDDLERILGAAIKEAGGLEKFLGALLPGAPYTPASPKAFAELLLADRNFALMWDAFELIISAPDEAVGQLVDPDDDDSIGDDDAPSTAEFFGGGLGN